MKILGKVKDEVLLVFTLLGKDDAYRVGLSTLDW